MHKHHKPRIEGQNFKSGNAPKISPDPELAQGVEKGMTPQEAQIAALLKSTDPMKHLQGQIRLYMSIFGLK